VALLLFDLLRVWTSENLTFHIGHIVWRNRDELPTALPRITEAAKIILSVAMLVEQELSIFPLHELPPAKKLARSQNAAMALDCVGFRICSAGANLRTSAGRKDVANKYYLRSVDLVPYADSPTGPKTE
jgi:hypothetical protein